MQGDGRCLKMFYVFAVLSLQFFNVLSLTIGTFNTSGELVLGQGDADADMTVTRCIEREREALLAFQQGFVVDNLSRQVFSSWGREAHKQECCRWKGVSCHNQTGHVLQLDLRSEYHNHSSASSMLQGKMISPKLIELQHLEYLDLSDIYFNGSQLPDFIGSLTNLRHLDLSYAYSGGQIPYQIGNLTNLQYLDLSYNSFSSNIVVNLNWLPQLSSLTYLDLSVVNLSDVFDWPEAVNKLPNLRNLTLVDCDLPSPPIHSATLSNINASKSLAHLDLDFNHLTSSIFPWLSNYNTSLLVYLDLGVNHISGSIPDVFGNMSSLTYLSLSENRLKGGIPPSFARLCSLQSLEYLFLDMNNLAGPIPNLTNFLSLKQLRLNNNQLSGKIPESIGQLSKLEIIDLGMNALEGVISEAHFSGLSRLKLLDLSFNPLVLNFPSDWVPPFQLVYINLGSCKLGPHFPKWLQTQKHYSYLDISHAGISDRLPSWFSDLSPKLWFMNISNNQIKGTFENSKTEFTSYTLLDLSWNQLEGPLPSIFSQVSHLDLSNNKISGSMSSLCKRANTSSFLGILSLSNNNVSGELPECLTHLERLVMLDLSNNSLSGKIPKTIGSLFQIETLKLRGNKFSGALPSSLKNCTSLRVLDIGDNEISGPLPPWLGVSLQDLVILLLSANHFNGSMPSELCHLSHIQILDFSMNNISGSIPKCLKNLIALAQTVNSSLTITHYFYDGANSTLYDVYSDDATLIWKRRTQVYKNTLGLVKSIDLSINRLTGEIPREITHLVGLVSVNLSRNQLTGQIPLDIGKLDSLDSLDLSRNQIHGRIPTSLARIDRLGVLDLSHNNLSGQIPTGTQLQGFDPSVYAANPQLCGPPLTKPCTQEQTTSHDDQEDKDELITTGVYISMALGFAVGFWGVFGSLILNRTWRHTYFKFLNVLNDWLYVRVALIKRRFKDMVKR